MCISPNSPDWAWADWRQIWSFCLQIQGSGSSSVLVSLHKAQSDPWSWTLQTGRGLPETSVLRRMWHKNEMIPTYSLSFTILSPVKLRTKLGLKEHNPHLSKRCAGEKKARGVQAAHGRERNSTPGDLPTGGSQPAGQDDCLWRSCSHQLQPWLLA